MTHGMIFPARAISSAKYLGLFASFGFWAAGCGMINESGLGGGMNLGGALELSCLDSMPAQLSAFAEGTVANDEEAARPFDCVDRALGTFATITRGESMEYYQSEELRGFLNRYFMTTRQVSPELMSSLMQLKAAVLGGTADRISRHDVAHIREFLKTVKTEAARLRSVIPLFMGGRNLGPDAIAATTPLLVQTAENVGAALEVATGPYTFVQLDTFIAHLNRFIHSTNPEASGTSTLALVGKCVPLMAGTKALIFGGTNGADIRANEWKTLLRVGAHLAVGYMTYANAPRDMHWVSEPGVRVVAGIAAAFAASVREIPNSTGMLTHLDQIHFRDTAKDNLIGSDDYVRMGKYIGLGLLGARALFADADGNLQISRIEALPAVLNGMAPNANIVAEWAANITEAEIPFESFSTAGRLLADYMAARAPLDQSFVEDSIRFVTGLVPDTDKYLTYVPLAFAAKAIIVGHSTSRLAGQNWRALIDSAAELAATTWLFRSQVLGSTHSWQSEAFQNGLRAAVTSALASLKRIVSRHPRSVLTFDTVDEALFAFENFASVNEIELPVTIPTISRTVRTVFKRLLAGRDPNIRSANGLTIPAILVAKHEFLRWSITQGLIENAFLQQVPAEQIFGSVLPMAQLNESAEAMRATVALREPGEELLDLLNRSPRLLVPGKIRLLFTATQRGRGMRNFEELTMLNIVRSAAKLIGEGFTEQEEDSGPLAITREQMQAAFEGVFPLMLELHQVDSDDNPEKLAADLTKYGNLFASNADGGTVIQEGEAAEMLLHVLSARGMRTELMVELARAGCPPITGTPEAPASFEMGCVRRKLFDVNPLFVRFFLPVMPRMVADVLEFSPQDRTRFFRALEDGGREGAAESAPVTASQIKRMIHLLQFSESMVQRLDLDWSSTLEINEAMNGAFPIFQRELQVASHQSGGMLEAIFGHIIRYGVPPRTPDGCRGLQCVSRVVALPTWLLAWELARRRGVQMDLSRLKLMTLFAALASS